MNTQTTPGPWHVLPRNRVTRSGQPTFDILAGQGGPENWDMVADRVDGEANARLIAKAPEMYRLLTILSSDNQSPEKTRATQSHARALLAEIGGTDQHLP